MMRNDQPKPHANGRHYIKVRAQKGRVDFGHTFLEDPEDVIAAWRKAGGILLPGSTNFILWHTIESIEFERNWKPPYHEPGQ